MDENTNVSVNPTEEKKFSQKELDDIVVARLSKSEKSLLSKLGLGSKDEIESLVERIKDYDVVKSRNGELETQVASLTSERTKSQYLRVIEKQNVDDEVIELVYSKVEPKKDEKVDDYKVRVEEYLANHTNFIKGSLTVINTSANLGGKATTNVSTNKRMNDFIRRRKD